MSATDELRKLLDERGVRHEDEFLKSNIPFYDGLEMTEWNGGLFSYVEMINHPPDTPPDAPDLTIHNCTPEQAIAATLGERSNTEQNGVGTCKVVRTAHIYVDDARIDISGADFDCGHYAVYPTVEPPKFCPYCGKRVER